MRFAHPRHSRNRARRGEHRRPRLRASERRRRNRRNAARTTKRRRAIRLQDAKSRKDHCSSRSARLGCPRAIPLFRGYALQNDGGRETSASGSDPVRRPGPRLGHQFARGVAPSEWRTINSQSEPRAFFAKGTPDMAAISSRATSRPISRCWMRTVVNAGASAYRRMACRCVRRRKHRLDMRCRAPPERVVRRAEDRWPRRSLSAPARATIRARFLSLRSRVAVAQATGASRPDAIDGFEILATPRAVREHPAVRRHGRSVRWPSATRCSTARLHPFTSSDNAAGRAASSTRLTRTARHARARGITRRRDRFWRRSPRTRPSTPCANNSRSPRPVGSVAADISDDRHIPFQQDLRPAEASAETRIGDVGRENADELRTSVPRPATALRQ